jgi:hypothetical protein
MPNSRRYLTSARIFLAAMCGVGAVASIASGQGMKAPTVHGADVQVQAAGEGADSPQWMARLGLSADSPSATKLKSQAQERREAEKALRKLRFQYLGQKKHLPTREEGLARLRDFDTPSLYPLLIDLFKDDQADVNLFLLDRFAQSRTPEGDASMAWVGVNSKHAEIRAAAVSHLRERLAKEPSSSFPVRMVLYEGFKSRRNESMVASAKLASALNLVEVLPYLIASQATQRPTSTTASAGTGGGDGALAWIMVGEQTAFVSDLTPVVGPNAVAFDPQLSVINTGTLLRVLDAVVIEYRVELHRELVDWTSREFGQDTSGMGYDYKAWRTWYDTEFMPHIAARAARAAAAAKALPDPNGNNTASPAANTPGTSGPQSTPTVAPSGG